MAEIIPIRREPDVEPARPFIDSKSFCDTWGLRRETVEALASRGIVYLTAFTRSGKEYGGSILAASWNQAEQIAKERGLGETVIGKLCEEVTA